MILIGLIDFIIWHCSLRQRIFTMFNGKASDGIIALILDMSIVDSINSISMFDNTEGNFCDNYDCSNNSFLGNMAPI